MKRLSAEKFVKLPAEINSEFVAVTSDPEFCLKTTRLYNDTRNKAL